MWYTWRFIATLASSFTHVQWMEKRTKKGGKRQREKERDMLPQKDMKDGCVQ